ncbi:MAG: hypothetical protein KGM15_02640 [Pseudomonadota bacterium]|nr:hypothetical protein [Pseudomonadota bacterium]
MSGCGTRKRRNSRRTPQPAPVGTVAGSARIEARQRETAGRFAVGDEVTLADICLFPQLYISRRFALDLSPFPKMVVVEARARALPVFTTASPESQPDAE